MSDNRGIFRRMRDWLFGEPKQEPPVPPRMPIEYAPPDDEEPVVVSAKGGVFVFHLIPAFRWASSAMSYAELEKCAGRYHGRARATLLHQVWATARAFRPDETGDAEIAINRELENEWCFEDDEGRVTCRSKVRLLLDPDLREHMLPVEKQRLDVKAQHDLAMLDADLVKSRTQRWLEIISTLEELRVLGPDERQLLVPFAASLADQDFAKVMHGLAAHRSQLAVDLASVLRQARSDHEHVGLYEFANAYDKALQSFCRQMGLTPFSWALAVSGGNDGEAGGA